MKRRTFVRSAAFGAMGLCLTPDILPFPFLPATGSREWLHKLVDACAAKRLAVAPQSTESFREQTASLAAYFSKRGYVKNGGSFYFYQAGGSFCFFSMKLQHGVRTLDDVLVPILQLDTDGAWRHIRTLTGYQLEALAKAADALAGHPEALQGILLPGAGRPGVPRHLGYSAQHADVTTITRILRGKAETSIAIQDGERVYFKETFQSKHGLTSTARVQILFPSRS